MFVVYASKLFKIIESQFPDVYTYAVDTHCFIWLFNLGIMSLMKFLCNGTLHNWYPEMESYGQAQI